jgi:hypothetical protein
MSQLSGFGFDTRTMTASRMRTSTDNDGGRLPDGPDPYAARLTFSANGPFSAKKLSPVSVNLLDRATK